MKRIAVQLYGHMRTYRYTYKNFFKYIIHSNQNDGYEIDIFIHTWEEFNRDKKECWYSHQDAFPTLNNKRLKSKDIADIIEIYKPKKILINTLQQGVLGQSLSLDKVAGLRIKYEKENRIKYDYIFTTRPDILFLKNIRIKYYLDLYQAEPELKGSLPDKFLFSSTILFRLGVIDGRYANEGDLVFFANFDARWKDIFRGDIPRIFACAYEKDFIILRENMLLNYKEQETSNHCNKKNNLLNFTYSKYGTAKQRIQNQLCYKLGQTMIINSKSIIGILFMPIYLLSTFLNYKQDQKIYHQKIKKDPTLKLPPLENYPDYQEALKYKEHLSYKLGKILLESFKTWHKGGLFKLWYKIRSLNRLS
ncbi:hypothetical protein [Campylobacter jejuni]|uniref:hypothetical protein n=1 Tax=Campylobacter jejuni TaxID=197 RepID=UPI0020439C16|nr:hypothetical protein [Campylobacter jejuni]GKY27836.1 hypothetical protein THJ062_11040 [Campylobacter jejuni]